MSRLVHYLRKNAAGEVVERREILLGDLAEKIAKPVAKALKLPCVNKDGNLRPESGCGKRKEKWNKIKLRA